MTTPNNPPLPEPDYVHGDWRGDAYTPGALRAYGDARAAAAFASHLKAPQGTATCVAFTLGAEWFREQYLAHVGVELEKE